MIDLLLLLGFGGACLAAGATGMLFKPGAWYRALAKPAWTPPNLAFPIVWTTLYVLMAWAAIRVAGAAAQGGPEAARAMAGLGLWSLQITLNALWSPIFFGLHRPRVALAVIGAMWLALAGTVWGFAGVDPVAAWMMAPALVWASIAASLNAWIMRHNPAEAFTA
ncbi:MAG: benzodiazapine receptor [Paracoccaceae bacterium]|jgi:benzodiazapine receptor